MHSARSTQVAEVVLHVRRLTPTDALVDGRLTVGGAEVQLVRRGIKYGDGRRPLARSLLGCLCRLNDKLLLSRQGKGIRLGHAGIQPGRLGSSVAGERGGEVQEGWVGFHDG